jgi:6-phosphogluconolactonase
MPGDGVVQLIVDAQPAQVARLAADWLEREVTGAIAEQGTCALALSGGRTPEPVYRELAAGSSIDWRRVNVFFGDERAVPADHPDSNYLMVHRALLSRVSIPSANVHRMEAEQPDYEAAAREYEHLLPTRLDVLLLGMGADGHTASLFPGSAALDERHRLVLPVLGPRTPPQRLTITPPVIEAARKVAVIATGEDKAVMVARAIEGPFAPKAVPVQLARRGVWFLDEAAAGRLTPGRVAT